jgi:hypothetical protein
MGCRGLMVKACMGVLIVISTLLSSQAATATVLAAQYPQPVLMPAAPTNADSVMFWMVLGQYPTTCTPLYVSKFSIKEVPIVCFMAPCPAQYEIDLRYDQIMVKPQPGYVCGQTITEYGPRFNFGVLSPGGYTLIDSMTGKTITTFTVTNKTKAYTISGSVYEDNGIIDVKKAVPQCKVYLSRDIIWTYLDKKAATADSLYTGPILPFPPYVDSTVTNASGLYKFKPVAAGDYTLDFSANGFQPKSQHAGLPSDTVVNVGLLPVRAFASVKGTVREACPPMPTPGIEPMCYYPPVPGCTVTVLMYTQAYKTLAKRSAGGAALPAAGPTPYGVVTAVTDANGAYSLDSVPVTYDSELSMVWFSKAGYTVDSKPVSLYPNGAAVVDFTMLRYYENIASQKVDGIIFSLSTDNVWYKAGYHIPARYSVKNNSIATVSFQPGACSQYDMTAVDGKGTVVYTYPGPWVDCLPTPRPIINLPPGDSVSYEFGDFFADDTVNPITLTAKVDGYDKSSVSLKVWVMSGATPVKGPVAGGAGIRPAVTYSVLTKTLYLTVDKSQKVKVDAYTVDGKKVPQFSRDALFTAGTHALGLGAAGAANCVIVRIKGETFTFVNKIALVPAR